jgi:hypothetical protein
LSSTANETKNEISRALLGHVAEAPAHRGVDRPALPADLAAVGLEHAQHDPHRRRLAGPIGADEAEELPRLDRERQPVERDRLAVAA